MSETYKIKTYLFINETEEVLKYIVFFFYYYKKLYYETVVALKLGHEIVFALENLKNYKKNKKENGKNFVRRIVEFCIDF